MEHARVHCYCTHQSQHLPLLFRPVLSILDDSQRGELRSDYCCCWNSPVDDAHNSELRCAANSVNWRGPFTDRMRFSLPIWLFHQVRTQTIFGHTLTNGSSDHFTNRFAQKRPNILGGRRSRWIRGTAFVRDGTPNDYASGTGPNLHFAEQLNLSWFQF